MLNEIRRTHVNISISWEIKCADNSFLISDNNSSANLPIKILTSCFCNGIWNCKFDIGLKKSTKSLGRANVCSRTYLKDENLYAQSSAIKLSQGSLLLYGIPFLTKLCSILLLINCFILVEFSSLLDCSWSYQMRGIS